MSNREVEKSSRWGNEGSRKSLEVLNTLIDSHSTFSNVTSRA